MKVKTKSLHNMSIEGMSINTQLHYILKLIILVFIYHIDMIKFIKKIIKVKLIRELKFIMKIIKVKLIIE